MKWCQRPLAIIGAIPAPAERGRDQLRPTICAVKERPLFWAAQMQKRAPTRPFRPESIR